MQTMIIVIKKPEECDDCEYQKRITQAPQVNL